MGILDNPEPAATPNGATAPLVRRNVGRMKPVEKAAEKMTY